jgi:hypothetical protein
MPHFHEHRRFFNRHVLDDVEVDNAPPLQATPSPAPRSCTPGAQSGPGRVTQPTRGNHHRRDRPAWRVLMMTAMGALCCVNSASSTCTRRQLAIRTRGVSPFLRLRVHPVCVSQAEPGLARPHPHPWGTRSARHGKGQVPAPAAPSEGWAWPAPAAAGPGRPAVTTQRPACAHEGERASSTPARSSGRASRRSPTCAISCHWMRGRPVRNTSDTTCVSPVLLPSKRETRRPSQPTENMPLISRGPPPLAM